MQRVRLKHTPFLFDFGCSANCIVFFFQIQSFVLVVVQLLYCMCKERSVHCILKPAVKVWLDSCLTSMLLSNFRKRQSKAFWRAWRLLPAALPTSHFHQLWGSLPMLVGGTKVALSKGRKKTEKKCTAQVLYYIHDRVQQNTLKRRKKSLKGWFRYMSGQVYWNQYNIEINS